MVKVSYRIEDNNNYLRIFINNKHSLIGLPICYCESQGFYFDCDFSEYAINKFGYERLNEIKDHALWSLNDKNK